MIKQIEILLFCTLLLVTSFSCTRHYGNGALPLFEEEQINYVVSSGENELKFRSIVPELIVGGFIIDGKRINVPYSEGKYEGHDNNGDIRISQDWIDVMYVFENRVLTIKTTANHTGKQREARVDCYCSSPYVGFVTIIQTP